MEDQSSTPGELYFFRVFTDGVQLYESEGLAFSSREDAWMEASISTGDIIRSLNGNMRPDLEWRMDVTNAAGDLLYRFTLKVEEFNPDRAAAR
jgi:hypothetical protein